MCRYHVKLNNHKRCGEFRGGAIGDVEESKQTSKRGVGQSFESSAGSSNVDASAVEILVDRLL